MNDIKIWESNPSQIINLPIFILLIVLLFVVLLLPHWIADFILLKSITAGRVLIGLILMYSLHALWVYLQVRSIRYELTSERLLIYSGVLNQKREEIELYRICDYKVYSSLINRVFGLGNIQLITSERSSAPLILYSVKEPFKVTDIVRSNVEKVKLEKKILFINS